MKPNSWAVLCHLGGLTGYLGNAIGSILVPLILWLIKRDEIPEVDAHGKEAVNFNISVSLYIFILGAITFVTFGLAFFITVPLIIVITVFHIICVIQAAIRANNGEMYRYPLTIRLVN